jgi:biotin carboxyl carrier protein
MGRRRNSEKMKLTLILQHGSRTSEHQLELRSPTGANGGPLSYLLNQEAGEADWAEVAPGVYSILLGGCSYQAQVTSPPDAAPTREARRMVTVGTRHYRVEIHDPRRQRIGADAPSNGPQEIVAPIPGKVVKILVVENQEVSQGAGLLVIEAMKMQNELRAPRAGRVERIYVAPGKGVETGMRLVRLV